MMAENQKKKKKILHDFLETDLIMAKISIPNVKAEKSDDPFSI